MQAAPTTVGLASAAYLVHLHEEKYRQVLFPGEALGDAPVMMEVPDDHPEMDILATHGTGVDQSNLLLEPEAMENPLFEPDEEENLDADFDDAPLWFHLMSELVGTGVPPGRVEWELANSENDRVYTASAEEPSSVVCA
ncbi:hypothetical protein GUJ93_ZPchr0010g7438 [Zizania palustris]|uniref:Uncharacterized protein n=1 Tax=Zizania palustris TaxID=103762 RepID=A0A8J6BNF3_ZIZPA|nr:hypothetical protein GUJ93_ZPchr0010g7438 [Zizania palustris]